MLQLDAASKTLEQTCIPLICLHDFVALCRIRGQCESFPDTESLGLLKPTDVDVQISIDLFVMAQSYVDLASLRDLCHQSAGQLYHYCPFAPEIDADQLQNDLRWNVIRPQVTAVHQSLLLVLVHG